MWKLIIRRCFIMIPQLFLLSVIVFMIAQAMPGDPLTGFYQSNPNISQEVIDAQRERYGLNDPWYVQYVRWVGNALQGDFGDSYQQRIPVTEVIDNRIWNTIWLSLLTLIMTYMIAIPLGLLSGRYNDTLLDRAITGYTYVGFAAPVFITSLLMLFLFGFQLGWFPTGGSVSPHAQPGTFGYVLSKINHMLLPAFSLAIITTVATVQYLRSELIDQKQSDYVRTARARGASERRIYLKHLPRNSLLPIAAFFGYELTGLIGGTIFVEMIFSYPGMGQLFLSSIMQRDYSVVTTMVLLFGVASILGALLSDIILSIVDPRIKIK
ncbi:oligopeptide ABC transporter permease [Halalkalibacterium halodurans]|uniref:oligopeptide ABC transporter permease n=2 Tax=Halalkalibacterium halodurans TaxID=86665 RepID=UPI002AA9B0B7|nr:oligopeptide ABC transporter permease [Halalkalibacterium halodurans]MDY7224113.1 oligopeptide ABC transporter permease [Halalkalibacterium halodurans]MDY7243398.1 oligopeptide ABC transporter permease [Halalkalibacterium halodurans]